MLTTATIPGTTTALAGAAPNLLFGDREVIVFTAGISDRMLTELPRHFGGLEAMFRELYQNAWRAGAQNVTVTYQDDTGLLTFADDGQGCPDPRVLVMAGETGWDEIAVTEPAGEGFFSALNPAFVLWADVRSANWQTRLVPDQVLRKERLSAVPAAAIGGMQITLCLKRTDDPHPQTVLTWLRNARGLYPYHVIINGEEAPVTLWQPNIEVDTPVGKVGLRISPYKHTTRAIWEWRVIEGDAFSAALHAAATHNPLWNEFVREWNVYWIVDEHRCGVRPILPNRNDLINDQALSAAAQVIIETCMHHLMAVARQATQGWPAVFEQLPKVYPAWLRGHFGEAVLKELGWHHAEWDNLDDRNFYYVQNDGWTFEFGDEEIYSREMLLVDDENTALSINNAIAGVGVNLPYAVQTTLNKEKTALKAEYVGLRRSRHKLNSNDSVTAEIWIAKRITVGGHDLPFMLTEQVVEYSVGKRRRSEVLPVVVLAATADEASRVLLGQEVQLRGMDKPGELLKMIVNFIVCHSEDCLWSNGWVTSEWGEEGIDDDQVAADLIEQVSNDFIGGRVAKARERYHLLQSDLDDLNKALRQIKRAERVASRVTRVQREKTRKALEKTIALVKADLDKAARLGRLTA